MTSAYTIYQNKVCVRACTLIRTETNPDGLITLALWQKWVRKRPDARLRHGGGGHTALYLLEAVPEPYYSQIKAKWGDPEAVENALKPHFRIDAQARAFYDGFRFADGGHLTPEQVTRYTVNASVLNALIALKAARTASRKSRNGSTRGIMKDLAVDLVAFNEVLPKLTGGHKYSLPTHKDRISEKMREYQRLGYALLIDGRNRNENAKIVTPQMIAIWRSLYAGQRGLKPTHVDIYREYQRFLAGQIEIADASTGEVYDPTHEDFAPASERTIMEYQMAWENRVGTHALRSGDEVDYREKYIPWHGMKQPEYAGSIISVDDRQPAFEYAKGERMWFYNAADLGSEAFTTWVWGDGKKDIILEFYRQMVRLYHEWDKQAKAKGYPGVNLPAEIEAEVSLNSKFKDTFLQPGVMFQYVRIEANNPRGKRIERMNGSIRYQMEKYREGFKSRPFAKLEDQQAGPGKDIYISKDKIIAGCLSDIEIWNNTLHSDQQRHPGLSRWDVFLSKQHPRIRPINWPALLRHLGHHTETSMKAGRVILQGAGRLAAIDGRIALGRDLTNILQQIDGEEVDVYWLDDIHGNVLKALVYTKEGTLVCELLDHRYQRARLEQTEDDLANREIMSSYVSTVQAFIKRSAAEVSEVVVIEKEPRRKAGSFVMPGLEPAWQPTGPAEPEIADELPDEDTVPVTRTFSTDTADRF